MVSILLALVIVSISAANVAADPMVVKRQCVQGCYSSNDNYCASRPAGTNGGMFNLEYREYPVNKCFRDFRLRSGYLKYECAGDRAILSVYSDESCSTPREEEAQSQSLGCQANDDDSTMQAQFTKKAGDDLTITLCNVGEAKRGCPYEYQVSTTATECTALDPGSYYYTWGSSGELIFYSEQTDCQAKALFRALMIAKNITNGKPVVYSPSYFTTCNDLPVPTPPKKLEIYKCADDTCGECAMKDSAAYETYTSGECLYDEESRSYTKYECTKYGMTQYFYNDFYNNNGCEHPASISYLHGGCSRPHAVRGRSHGPDNDNSGVIVELCESECHNYKLVNGTTSCKDVGDSRYYYTWKGDILTVFASSEACTAGSKFGRVFVASGFDVPSQWVVYEQSVRVLCGGEGENSLPPRAPQVPLEIAACGDGNPTDVVDTCGVKKEGQCATSSDHNGDLFRAMTTGKCLWDEEKKRYYIGVCNSTMYGVYTYESYGCDTPRSEVLAEWGDTGCSESKLSRRARFVEEKPDNKFTVEYCFNASCGNFTLSNLAICSPMGTPEPRYPISTLPWTMYYTRNVSLIIYNTLEDCTKDTPSGFRRAFYAATFAEGSNVTYTPYQYATCDGQPVVGATTTSSSANSVVGGTNDMSTLNGVYVGFRQTQMIMVAMLIFFVSCI